MKRKNVAARSWLLAVFTTIFLFAVPAGAQQDDARYIVRQNIAVRTADGATVCVLVVRPRAIRSRLPAILLFTIYNTPAIMLREATRSAAHGYAGVIGLTRGKGCSPDKPVAYEHDAADADTVIDWIAKQSWSDGRVGMYGGSYSGFTSWAAAKHLPKALKTIMVGAANGPGIDAPPEGNVAWNFMYPWPFYTLNNKTLDDATYSNSARWAALDRKWYISGRAYHDLDKIDGTPNPVWQRWIAHPDYDAFWQSLIPYGSEFAQIRIPVLQTAGYYYGGPGAAVYYLTQHYRYDPHAEHYLVIGPYDHLMAQRGASAAQNTIHGYKLDPAALVNLTDLRYRWFDYIFKGAPKPALLVDKINYEVTGANVWKHAPSLAAMANERRRLYLSAARSGDARRLVPRPPGRTTFVPLTVDLADRRDVDRISRGGDVQDKAVDAYGGITFVSDPLSAATEISGLFSGHLDFTTNKRDFDFEIDLYELTKSGVYFQLAPYWSRASNVSDLTHRHLLTPGRREQVSFRAIRLMSRKLAQGSRLVAVLSVIKSSGRQINYGSGKNVSDETIADAGAPLTIKWFGRSFIDIPVATAAASGAR
jgi:putative CocE/NonD family hydrolase